ncbi:hypothetical protein KMW28_27285 [Flammeovirga yaeyamensis]|uniref:Uncharacterized protein n=1 Tax=Flammeovirga yaeyamensis TaxID=367791 RepID=A0AAX1NAL7_9BACT|nr:hypothetical protein [Flammeovirga yaeyamensis]MBB3700014.1 putative metalloenzyme YecM [Flammeovirga yaeyamensis]NMF37548.1 hypothetical protein [Flammeovirga yaeyamensis]QWG04605.1 hypothetical protein KMW28_27285 [Flammeovirga yaeyamensis]
MTTIEFNKIVKDENTLSQLRDVYHKVNDFDKLVKDLSLDLTQEQCDELKVKLATEPAVDSMVKVTFNLLKQGTILGVSILKQNRKKIMKNFINKVVNAVKEVFTAKVEVKEQEVNVSVVSAVATAAVVFGTSITLGYTLVVFSLFYFSLTMVKVAKA